MIASFSLATPQHCAEWCAVFKVAPEEITTEILASGNMMAGTTNTQSTLEVNWMRHCCQMHGAECQR
jgi:hypothetical protein